MRTLVLILLALGLGAAPAAAEPRPLERYREVFGPEVEVRWNAMKTAPWSLRGLDVPTRGASSAERALGFARENAGLLGLEDGEVAVAETRDAVFAGRTVRGAVLQRLWRGLPVEGQTLSVRMDGEDRVRSVTSSVGLLVVEEPSTIIDPASAQRVVRDTYAVAAVGAPTRVVRAFGNIGRVAWRVPVAVIPLEAHFFVWVDAASGRILGERPAGADQAMREIPLQRTEARP